MTFLPVVERELRIRSRRRFTYWARWIGAGLALLLTTPVLLTPEPGMPSGTTMGQMLFRSLAVLLFGFATVFGASITADAISQEKREGSLGLLFLTDLTGNDIILGKLAGLGMVAFYTLVAIIPVFALSLLAGGVTGAEFFRASLCVLNAMFFSSVIGLWISSRHEDAQKALFTATTWLLGLMALLPLADWLLSFVYSGNTYLKLLSPAYSLYLAFDIFYKTAPMEFWIGIALNFLGPILLLLWTGIRLQKNWQQSDHKQKRGANQFLESAECKARRNRRLDLNPIFWLANRGQRQKWLIRGLAGGISVVIFLTYAMNMALMRSTRMGVLINFFSLASLILVMMFDFLVGYFAARVICEAKQSGALELWLTTPLGSKGVTHGQWLSLKELFLGPAIFMCTAEIGGMILFYSLQPARFHPTWLLSLMVVAPRRILKLVSLGWMGAWASTNSKNAAIAAGKAILLVNLLPWIVCTLAPARFMMFNNGAFRSMYGLTFFFALVPYGILIYWARKRLRIFWGLDSAGQSFRVHPALLQPGHSIA